MRFASKKITSGILLSVLATCVAVAGCDSSPGSGPPTESGGTTGSGGRASSGGSPGSGGAVGSGGLVGSGGKVGSGGSTATGGSSATGGAVATGGSSGAGEHAGSSGAAGMTAAGGRGPMTGSGGRSGMAGRPGNPGSGGATSAGGASGSGGTTGAGGGSDTVDCNAAFPTGGNTYTGTNINGMADGLNYGIWTSGSGGSITVFPSAHAFSASWNNSQDFLAHVGLDFNSSKAYTAYGTILAQYSEKKTGSGGGYSYIGMYGWMHSPCIEWYINEDSFNGLSARGTTTAVIDGDTYYLTMTTTSGTGGANACEAGHSGGWMQIISTRKTARTCGTVTVSDHFAAWAKQGWSLGTLSSVHINVEVGGGSGSIQFPVANVTTTSK